MYGRRSRNKLAQVRKVHPAKIGVSVPRAPASGSPEKSRDLSGRISDGPEARLHRGMGSRLSRTCY